MRRGTVIVIVFILVAVGVVAISQFLRAQPPLEITIAVTPLVRDWAQAAATAFNDTNPLVNSTRRILIRVTTAEDTQVWLEDRRLWTAETHPDGWIAAANFSLRLAQEAGFRFETVEDSLAHTPLIWGGFSSRMNTLTEDGAESFDWAAAVNTADEVRFAFQHPARSVTGMAVLLSAAAEFADHEALTGADTASSQFRDWVRPVLESVPNFNTLGASVAETIAARGRSVGEIGLLPESEWLLNLRGQLVSSADPVRLSYPQYTVVFDFPLALWQGTVTAQTNPNAADIAAGVRAFGAWLASASQQAAAQQHGLRPAAGPGETPAELFARAVEYGVLFTPDLTRRVEPPARTELQRLATWVNSVVR